MPGRQELRWGTDDEGNAFQYWVSLDGTPVTLSGPALSAPVAAPVPGRTPEQTAAYAAWVNAGALGPPPDMTPPAEIAAQQAEAARSVAILETAAAATPSLLQHYDLAGDNTAPATLDVLPHASPDAVPSGPQPAPASAPITAVTAALDILPHASADVATGGPAPAAVVAPATVTPPAGPDASAVEPPTAKNLTVEPPAVIGPPQNAVLDPSGPPRRQAISEVITEEIGGIVTYGNSADHFFDQMAAQGFSMDEIVTGLHDALTFFSDPTNGAPPRSITMANTLLAQAASASGVDILPHADNPPESAMQPHQGDASHVYVGRDSRGDVWQLYDPSQDRVLEWAVVPGDDSRNQIAGTLHSLGAPSSMTVAQRPSGSASSTAAHAISGAATVTTNTATTTSPLFDPTHRLVGHDAHGNAVYHLIDEGGRTVEWAENAQGVIDSSKHYVATSADSIVVEPTTTKVIVSNGGSGTTTNTNAGSGAGSTTITTTVSPLFDPVHRLVGYDAQGDEVYHLIDEGGNTVEWAQNAAGLIDGTKHYLTGPSASPTIVSTPTRIVVPVGVTPPPPSVTGGGFLKNPLLLLGLAAVGILALRNR